jgi:hypothetical protein
MLFGQAQTSLSRIFGSDRYTFVIIQTLVWRWQGHSEEWPCCHRSWCVQRFDRYAME